MLGYYCVVHKKPKNFFLRWTIVLTFDLIMMILAWEFVN